MKIISLSLFGLGLLALGFYLAKPVNASGTSGSVELVGNKICYVYWTTGQATGTWRLRWNYYNGQSNLSYSCSARLTAGIAPTTTIHFTAINHPECNVKNVVTVNTKGQAKWSCQGKN